MGLHLPDIKCKYLTAKYQRALGRAEETAFTQHWSFTSLDMPGESNNLADLACRFASMFGDRFIDLLPVPRSAESEDEEPGFKSFTLTDHTPLASTLGVYYILCTSRSG